MKDMSNICQFGCQQMMRDVLLKVKLVLTILLEL